MILLEKLGWISPIIQISLFKIFLFGVFLTRNDIITIGTRIGDFAIDLGALHQLGYFKDIPLTDDIFLQDTLNDFIADGRKTWRSVRNRVAELFDANNDELKVNEKIKKPFYSPWTKLKCKCLFKLEIIQTFIPARNMLPMWARCLEIQKMLCCLIGCMHQLVTMVGVHP